MLGRVLAQRMSELLSQQIVVENVAGAGGTTGANRIAKAAPDGYQALLGNIATHAYSQTLYKKPLYDAAQDFAPVGLVAGGAWVLVVRKDLPVTTLGEFAAYARANQGKMQYGSAGVGSGTHITCVLLNMALGTNITHVPYRGSGPAMQDLMAGRIDFLCDVISTAVPQIEAGTVKANRNAGREPRRGAAERSDRRRAGLRRVRRQRLERAVLSEGNTGGRRATAEPGRERRAGHARRARAHRGARPQDSAACGAHAGVPRPPHPARDREMGRPDQGERRGDGQIEHRVPKGQGRCSKERRMSQSAPDRNRRMLSGAAAQDWPTRPITLVVPFAAGGGVDVSARIQAQHMSELLGQSIIVENVGAAAGMAGGQRVAKAAPDGYTLLIGNTGTQAYNQALYKKPLYNAATDFQPVGLMTESPRILVARKGLPGNGLQDLIAYLKANEGKTQFGSAGVGSGTHLPCVLFTSAIKSNVTHVPYRGEGPAMQDVIAGRTDFMCATIQSGAAQARDGTVKGIAIMADEARTDRSRSADHRRAGPARRRGERVERVLLPEGHADAIVRKLNKAMSDTVDNPAIHKRLEELGLEIVSPERRTPEYLAKFVPEEIERWSKVVQQAGISAD